VERQERLSEGEPGAYALSQEDVLDRAAEAAAAGATEIHVVGGLHPSLPLGWYLDVIRAVRRRYPQL
jgi:aminodeoxyfutalosine synthase